RTARRAGAGGGGEGSPSSRASRPVGAGDDDRDEPSAPGAADATGALLVVDAAEVAAPAVRAPGGQPPHGPAPGRRVERRESDRAAAYAGRDDPAARPLVSSAPGPLAGCVSVVEDHAALPPCSA